MKMRISVKVALTMAIAASLMFASIVSAAEGVTDKRVKDLPKGLYAIFETSMGTIICELFEKQAPKTVANFVGLAKGTKAWTDSRTGKSTKSPLYSGVIFHRIIPNFMAQTGDPLGSGRGGPGYTFADEFSPSLKFDRAGRLAMANRDPNTNGSQIFITHKPTSWLNNKHTIFGQVVAGQDIVDKMSTVKRDRRDKPLKDIVLKQVVIVKK